MSSDRNHKNWEQLLGAYDEPRISDDFQARLEDAVLFAARSSRESHFSRRLISALTAAAALLLIYFVQPEHRPVNEAHPPLFSFAMAERIDESEADEMRLTLLQLLAQAHAVVAGRLETNALTGGIEFQAQRLFKGEMPGPDVSSNEGPGAAFVCPAPPTFSADRWAVLFIHNGEVPTDQWKVEFEDKKEYDDFVVRVSRYRDGTITPFLLEELEKGAGRGPFAERDRIFEDVLYILTLTKDVNDYRRLVRATQSPYEVNRVIGDLVEVRDEAVDDCSPTFAPNRAGRERQTPCDQLLGAAHEGQTQRRHQRPSRQSGDALPHSLRCHSSGV